MSRKARNAADVLPKPIKPLKRIAPGNVVAVMRRARNFCVSKHFPVQVKNFAFPK